MRRAYAREAAVDRTTAATGLESSGRQVIAAAGASVTQLRRRMTVTERLDEIDPGVVLRLLRSSNLCGASRRSARTVETFSSIRLPVYRLQLR